MAWISGLLQSFRGPSRIARSASAAAADAGAEENAAATESGGRRRERRVRARSITASLDEEGAGCQQPARAKRTPGAAGSPPAAATRDRWAQDGRVASSVEGGRRSAAAGSWGRRSTEETDGRERN